MRVRYPRNFIEYFPYHFFLTKRGNMIGACAVVILFLAPRYGQHIARISYVAVVSIMLASAVADYYVRKGRTVYRILALQGFNANDSSERIFAASVLGHFGEESDIQLIADRLASLKLGDPERITCEDAMKQLQSRSSAGPGLGIGEHFGRPGVPETGKADPLVREAFIVATQRDWHGVVDRLMRYVSGNQEDWAAQYFLAAAHIETGNWQAAMSVAERGLEHLPTSNVWRARILHVLGDAAIMLQRDDCALSALEQAVSLSSTDSHFPTAEVGQKIELLQRGQGQSIRDAASRDPKFLCAR